jgi:replicative DNA helicase
MTGAENVPASVEHERQLLGALLVSGAGLPLCQEVGLAAEHFYFDRHQAIYRGIRRAAAEGAAGDELAAWTAMERLGLAQVVERHYVSELAATVASLNVRAHAQHLVALAGKRAKLEGAQLIAQGAVELDEGRSADLISEGMALVARDFQAEAEPTSREEIASEVIDYFDNQEPAEDIFALPWEKLNQGVAGGLRRGDVSVFAGHTNMGKSLVLDQSMAGFARQGRACAIFATEMPRMQRALRFIASETGIAFERLMLKRGLQQRDYVKIVDAASKLPFDYYECHGWSADRIAERILASGVDVAAVDPINKIPGFEETKVASRAATRFAEVAARGRLHLILVSHLNRVRVRDPRGVLPKPLRHDLRDSAMFETHAAQILFIHRNQDDNANVLPTGEIYWDKVRNGPKAAVKVELSSRLLRFFEDDGRAAQQQLNLPTPNEHDRELVA